MAIAKPKNRMARPIHPGEILSEEWLKPSHITQSALAQKMGIDVQVVNGIVRGRRAVTARTAIRLAKVLGTTPEFWMNLQHAYDLWEARKKFAERSA